MPLTPIDIKVSPIELDDEEDVIKKQLPGDWSDQNFIDSIQNERYLSIPKHSEKHNQLTPESGIGTDDGLPHFPSKVKEHEEEDKQPINFSVTGSEYSPKALDDIRFLQEIRDFPLSQKDDQCALKNEEDEYDIEAEKTAISCAESVLQETYSDSSDWSSEEDSSCSSSDQYQNYPYDQSFDYRYSQLKYDYKDIIRKKDSLAKIELSTEEKEKYECIWQKIDKIHYDLDRSCEKDEDYYTRCEKEFYEAIDQALKQGIMFTFPYKKSFIDLIIDTLEKLYLSYDTTRIYEFIDKTKISKIISEGAFLNEFTKKEHEDYVNIICADETYYITVMRTLCHIQYLKN